MWLWTCRQGFEGDLVEELSRGKGDCDPKRLGEALVSSERRPVGWPVFARAGFPVTAEVAPDADAVAAALATALTGTRGPWLLQAWVPDTDDGNLLSQRVLELADAARAKLPPSLEARQVARADDNLRYGGTLAQLCLAGQKRAYVGALAATDVPTLAPGGRVRAARPDDAPSRAARKLNEALEWFGRAPEPGDRCVDLGAAPGGWTAVLLERRAKVIAVDPAMLSPELRAKKGVTHVKASAFEFIPNERVDWLFCDMAWRPLEVAGLLAKWGKLKLAQALVANIKLPMKQRAEFAERVCKIVSNGGWRDLKARQLYHDREEITLAAWRT